MHVSFRPEAEAELLEAQAWYEERSPGLGLEFARAVDVAVAKASRNPLAYSRIAEEFRHVVLLNDVRLQIRKRPCGTGSMGGADLRIHRTRRPVSLLGVAGCR